MKIVHNLKTKSFHDKISGSLLCDMLVDIKFAKQLLYLVNTSLSAGLMPFELKESIISPIPKKKLPKNPEHYRGINNLPVIEKIIETVVHEQLAEYLKKANIIIKEQAGYRKYHSTESSIQNVCYDWVEALENNQYTIAVGLDFRRAYETVIRRRLIEKLERYGIADNALLWFMSFLSQRRQITIVNGVKSESKQIEEGLPQGSKLAAILFVIYINDLVMNIPHAKVNLYADDSLLYLACDNLMQGEKLINDALEAMFDWLCFNSMAVNIEKCSYMIISNKPNINELNININGQKLEKVKCMKYLGCLIDDKLNFNEHYEMTKGKIYQKVGLLRRLKHKMNQHSRMIFFKSIIYTHINYVSSITFAFSNEKVQSIQKVLNKALRVVLNSSRDTNIQSMLNVVNVQPVKRQIIFNSLKFLHNVNKRGLPLLIFEKLNTNSKTRQRTLRNDNNFSLPKWIKESSRKSIFYKGIQLLNILYHNYDSELSFESNFNNFYTHYNP
jgi:hypothetical protein